MRIMTKRATVAAMAVVLASTMAVNAEAQHAGGGGGGHMGGGGGFRGGHIGGGGGFRGGHMGSAGHVRGGFEGRSVGHGFHGRQGFDGRFHGSRFHGSGFFIRGGFFDPFWGGFYPYGLFPFAYYPYAGYAYGLTLNSDLKVNVTPKDAQVFVDGYYAGESNERVPLASGGHVITIYRDGYRTVTRSIYAGPGSTVKFSDRLEPLRPGEVSAPPTAPASPTVAPVAPQAPSDDSGQ